MISRNFLNTASILHLMHLFYHMNRKDHFKIISHDAIHSSKTTNSNHNRCTVHFTNRLISTRQSVFDDFDKLLDEPVESSKFDFFYDVCVEKIILDALNEFRTSICFSTISNHVCCFWSKRLYRHIFWHSLNFLYTALILQLMHL